jgi:hypothetical protein
VVEVVVVEGWGGGTEADAVRCCSSLSFFIAPDIRLAVMAGCVDGRAVSWAGYEGEGEEEEEEKEEDRKVGVD